MDNRETLQSHNTRLNINNSTIDQIIEIANNLPTESVFQDKSIEITENGTITVTPDGDYDGLSSVEIITNAKEDLDAELTVQNEEITEQEVSIDDIKSALNGKSAYKTKYAPRWISFYYYPGTDLDREVANLDTSNMTSFYYMFQGCSKLTRLDLSNFDTSKVTDMSQMFQACSKLTQLDLSNFDTSKVTKMGNMFRLCSALTRLDIRNFTFDSVTSYDWIFSGIPTDCEIIVKDDTAKAWVLARDNSFTNVKTVAELEG